MTWTFTVPGPAVAQGRPRFTTRPFPHAVDPPKSREYKALVRQCALEQTASPKMPHEGPIVLRIVDYRQVPKAKMSKFHNGAALWPTVRPDEDNVIKAVMDALTGVFWADDKQVCAIFANKIYDDEGPRVEVQVSVWGGEV